MDWALDGEYQKGSETVLIENRKQALTIIRPKDDECSEENEERAKNETETVTVQ